MATPNAISRESSSLPSNQATYPLHTTDSQNLLSPNWLPGSDPIQHWPSVDHVPFTDSLVRSNVLDTAGESQRYMSSQLAMSGFGEDPANFVKRHSAGHATSSMTWTSPSLGYDHGLSRSLLHGDSDPSGLYPGNTQAELSPTAQSFTELTNGTTLPSDLSRQASDIGSSLCGPFDMIRLSSSRSNLGLGFDTQTYEMDPGRQDLDLRGTGGVSQHFDPQFSDMPCSLPDSFEMTRATSNESDKSAASNQSARLQQRRKDLLANSLKRLEPKPMNVSKVPEPPMLQANAAPSRKANKTRKQKTRRTRDKILCLKCNEHPEGFRGEHELRRHDQREHSTRRLAWVCVDVSNDQTFLSDCKACKKGKTYGAYYNAAAHLRRVHFNRTQSSSPSNGHAGKNTEQEPKGGKSGGSDPPMRVLKNWMKEVWVDQVGDIEVGSDEDAFQVEGPNDERTPLFHQPSSPQTLSFGDDFSRMQQLIDNNTPMIGVDQDAIGGSSAIPSDRIGRSLGSGASEPSALFDPSLFDFSFEAQ